MKKKKGTRFLSLLAIIFPWMVMIIYDNPAGFLITLILQATAIGWIPASIWAWKVVHAATKEDKENPGTNNIKK